jgi:hypothetical protein
MASEKKALSLKEKYPEIYAQKDIDRRGYKACCSHGDFVTELGTYGYNV